MNITIYSTTTCSFCHVLEAWLDKQGLSYTTKITDQDPEAMAEYLAINDGMIGVPFTVITDEKQHVTKILGFDQKKLKQALDL